MGVTHLLTFTLNRGFDEKSCKILAAVVDTDAYCVLLSMPFIAGVVDTLGENFYYRYKDAQGTTQLTTLPAPCHSPTPPVVAYAFFAGLISSSVELLHSVGSTDRGSADGTVPEVDNGPEPAPHQLAVIQVQILEVQLAGATTSTLESAVATDDAARCKDAEQRLAANIPHLNPSSSWIGEVVEGVLQINTNTRTWPRSRHTNTMKKAAALVESFIGALVMVEEKGLGAAALLVGLFGNDVQNVSIFQSAIPSSIPSSPPSKNLLHSYITPTNPGHINHHPFSSLNHEGGGKRGMPTIVFNNEDRGRICRTP